MCVLSCLQGHLSRLSLDVVLDLFAVLQLLLQLLDCILHSISGHSHTLQLILQHMNEHPPLAAKELGRCSGGVLCCTLDFKRSLPRSSSSLSLCLRRACGILTACDALQHSVQGMMT